MSSCMDKTLNSVTGSMLDPIFNLVNVTEHLHLLTLSFTVDEELWRYNCMRLDVCEHVWIQKFQRDGTMRNLFSW